MNLSSQMVLIGVIGTCILIPALIISFRWTKAAITGWLIFFVAILPTMQLIGFTNVIAADKFMYLPKIGLLMAIAAGCVWLFKKFKGRAAYVFIVIVLALGTGEAIASRRYLVQWRDSMSLYRYALSVTEDNFVVHYNIGLVLAKENKLTEAEYYFSRCLELHPDHVQAMNNIGNIFLIRGDLNNAIDHYRKAVKLNDKYVESHYNLGVSLFRKGDFEGAEKHLFRATELDPSLAIAFFDLGNVYEAQSKIKLAIAAFEQVLKLEPSNIAAKNKVAKLLKKSSN
jgi:tetratricopeptide (TPR) repeat protein